MKQLIINHCVTYAYTYITLDSRLSNCDVTSDEFEEVEDEMNNREIDEKVPLFITYCIVASFIVRY